MQDTVMIVNLWSFHNDPDFWGDPELFRPERFLDEQGQLLKKDYSLPFAAGLYHHFLKFKEAEKFKPTLNNFLLSKTYRYVNLTLMIASWKN
jgi:hypothetical protein